MTQLNHLLRHEIARVPADPSSKAERMMLRSSVPQMDQRGGSNTVCASFNREDVPLDRRPCAAKV
ncbi:uncharacterized protein RCO7_15049 [Rhynchosporium graminicola]|uniref:Uncharacterized protein n=1 Tax=Rhynchosporium graminicola TaxID=2792576 RepID=A0A1E1LJX2_9HELO|nr:uncharacterized protein RCO7_15049 [Rhynchosporium commune]